MQIMLRWNYVTYLIMLSLKPLCIGWGKVVPEYFGRAPRRFFLRFYRWAPNG